MSPLQFREARLAFGLTQTGWGLALGVGREHIAKIETDKATPSRTLVLLVEAYQRHGLPPKRRFR